MSARLSLAGSLKWVGVMQAGRVIIQAAGLLVLARLLPAADFGTMALAMAAVTFANLFGDMGTAAAIVQQRCISNERINAVFWFNIGIGALLGAALIATAPLISMLLQTPDLSSVLISLSPLFLIGGASVVHQSLLERESRFQAVTVQNLLAGSLGVIAALCSAFSGLGIYSLVIQALVSATVSCLALWKLSEWRPAWKADFSELRAIRGFSGNVLMASIMNYAHRNADALIIGRLLGASQLGLYTMAYRLMMFPLQNLTFAFNRAALPAYSRAQDDLRVVGAHYLNALRRIAVLTAPIMGVAWLSRDTIIPLVLGSKWAESAVVFAWLAPVGFLQSVISTSGVVLQAANETRTLRNLTLVGTPLLVGSFLCGAPWGIEGIAKAYCIANAIWLFPVMSAVMSALGERLTQALISIFVPAAIMLAIFGIAHIILHTNNPDPTHVQTLLATSVAAGVYALCVRPVFSRRIAVA